MQAEIERVTPFLKGDEDFERIWRSVVFNAKKDSIGARYSGSAASVVGVANWDEYLETWRVHASTRWPISSASPAERFALARDIDPKYGVAFDRARARGVEAMAWKCMITMDGIEIAERVAIVE